MPKSKGSSISSVSEALHPSRAEGCISEQFAALLVYLLDEPPVTIPCIVGLRCDEKEKLWACLSNESHCFNAYLGTKNEVTTNLHNWSTKWNTSPDTLISRVPSVLEETRWSDLLIKNWQFSFVSVSELRKSQTWIL